MRTIHERARLRRIDDFKRNALPTYEHGGPVSATNGRAKRVVIAEPFAEIGMDVLRARGLEVISCVGKPREALVDAIATADAVIVRSETKVDRAMLGAMPNVVVVGRAGTGVDTIDVDAATEAGILVLNVPGANSVTACELTFAHMLSLARRVPDSVQQLREGIWNRKDLLGTELYGKTLGIVGLGRIGGLVATRASAFGMTLLAHDPFISEARAESFKAKLLPLEEVLAQSDIVTLHVPLTAQTRGMIAAEHLRLMKPTAYIVNCARGGVIDEQALLDALDAGTIAAAGIDVVTKEPPPPDGTGARLHRHPKLYATTHIGGNTHEALQRIATELAADVANVLAGNPAVGAVNAPVADGPDAGDQRAFVDVAFRLGKLYPQLADEPKLPALTLVLEGKLAALPTDPIVTAFLSGLLQATTERRVSVVNARAIAQELDVHVNVRTDPDAEAYVSVLRVSGGKPEIAATTSANGDARLVAIDGYEMDSPLSGAMLVTLHPDRPGMIGKVGTICGEAGVNITTMQVSRRGPTGDAIMTLAVDKIPDDATVERLRAIAGFRQVRAIELPAR